MNSNIAFMFKMIAAIVTESELPAEPKEADWKEILQISLKHNIANIIAYAVNSGKYKIEPDISMAFNKKLYERIAVSEKQDFEIKNILEKFSENQIDFMPFKGTALNGLYPSRDMRFMTDADIFIKKEQYEKINQIMIDLGYEFEVEGPIEYNYVKKPYMHIELHFDLIAPSSEDLYDYYKDGWKFAKSTPVPHRYELGIEDHYIYIFNHFVRHYRDAGAGIKSIIDMWLYMRKYPDMDFSYIESEFSKINMLKFHKNLVEMIGVWFEDKKTDNEVIDIMTAFIIDSGTFGNIKNSVSAKIIRKDEDFEKAEKNKYINIIFPKFEFMRQAFPVLEKLPFLLPFFWIWRLIVVLLFRRSNIQKRKNIAESIDAENIKKYQSHMQDVGLDIYNGRKNK